MTTATAILLAAGMGTRMRSALPKALHPIAGQPMLRHLIESSVTVFDHLVVVVGPDMATLAALAAPHAVVVQHERRGTAHAALQAVDLFGSGEVAVLYADNPLIRPQTLSRLLARRGAGDVGLALLAMRPPEPGRYGRVLLDPAGRPDHVARIVEWSDASEAERATPLCNAGVLCGPADDMARWLRAVQPNNAAGEYYLTDLVALARADGHAVAAVEADHAELRGINSRAELAEAEATVQNRLRATAMAEGVSMVAPETVFLAADTRLAQDVSIGPNVVFGRGVVVEEGAEIRAFCHLEGCHIGPGAVVGPFARLRAGTRLGAGVHIGNFVETKAAVLGEGVKAGHLSYLGDADIGARTNIGAGTITCNYDGRNKHRTVIGKDAFIGSDTAFVAPVQLGDRAVTAAGSVITENVAQDTLAIARARQIAKSRRRADQPDQGEP
jgi:bifunctional UDP-N-acetylglucosamine pyrophosphorylase/glucosamine-1-phosphate N-acetyltransferase